MPELEPKSKNRKPQFGLINMFTWMILVAAVSVLFFNFRTTSEKQWRFQSLPPDDVKLKKWLTEERGLEKASVDRDENQLTITVAGRNLSLRQLSDIPEPPWSKLGYVAPQLLGAKYRRGFFGGSWQDIFLVAAVAFVLIFSLNWLGTRHEG